MPRPPILAALVAVPLYAAPFLSGLTGGPVVLLPVFVATWMIWQALVRPVGTQAVSAPLGRLWVGILVQALAVIALFAMGRGLVVLMGATHGAAAWQPIALALLPLPLARLLAGRPADRGGLDAAGVPPDQGASAGGRA